MKSLNNLISILLLAVLMVMLLILTVFSFGLTGSELLQNIEADLYQNLVAALIFLAIFLLTAWALYPLFKTKNKFAIISSDEHGSIKITLEALDKIIRGIVRTEKGLEIRNTELNSRDSGMEVKMRVAVEENQNIPALTERIKDDIRYRLKEITGAEIEKVQILIDSISPGKKKPDFSSETSRVKDVEDKQRRKEQDNKKAKQDMEIDKSKSERKADEIEEEKDEKSSMDKFLDKFRKKETETKKKQEDEDNLITSDEIQKETESDKDKSPEKDKLVEEKKGEEKDKNKNKKLQTGINNDRNDDEDKKNNLLTENQSDKDFTSNSSNTSSKEIQEQNRKTKDPKDPKDNDIETPGKF